MSTLMESTIKCVRKSDEAQLNHDELMKLTREAINKIIESDSLLNGLPDDATLEEIKAQTSVAQGQAITLYLRRGELPKLSIVVPLNNTTVLDLKKSIQRQINLSLFREKIHKKISWRHVWKKYNLCCNNNVMINNNENINNYGISNKVELYFIKRRREKK